MLTEISAKQLDSTSKMFDDYALKKQGYRREIIRFLRGSKLVYALHQAQTFGITVVVVQCHEVEKLDSDSLICSLPRVFVPSPRLTHLATRQRLYSKRSATNLCDC